MVAAQSVTPQQHISGDALRSWQTRAALTQQQAARAIGVSLATYKRYLTDGAGLTVALACAAVEAGLTPLE